MIFVRSEYIQANVQVMTEIQEDYKKGSKLSIMPLQGANWKLVENPRDEFITEAKT